MRRAPGKLLLAVVGALLALSGVGVSNADICEDAPRFDYEIDGDFLALQADNPNTVANEGTVTLTVTSANEHARNSGEIADQDANRPGVQVAGATYTAPTRWHALRATEYQGADTPSPGDRVKVRGLILRTRKACAPSNTSLADRYGSPDLRRVILIDRDADA